jgi:hypothetical protein
MRNKFGLQHEFVDESAGLNATGSKLLYYLKNELPSRIFGYCPDSTALEIVVGQSRKLLSRATKGSS